jgi:hypothetical protein
MFAFLHKLVGSTSVHKSEEARFKKNLDNMDSKESELDALRDTLRKIQGSMGQKQELMRTISSSSLKAVRPDGGDKDPGAQLLRPHQKA